MFRPLLFTLFMLTSCVTTLTPEGRKVRIEKGRPDNCKFVGTFEDSFSNGSNIADDRIQATKGVQNQIAAAGGNTLYIIDKGGDIFASTVYAEGYACPTAPE